MKKIRIKKELKYENLKNENYRWKTNYLSARVQ